MSRAKEKLRQHALKRAHFECEYCRSPQKLLSDDLELDHIWPKAKGGKATDVNICAACRKCNALKRTQTKAVDPISKKAVPLFHPRTQTWSDHFEFSTDAVVMIGKTAIGRATITALQLNRDRVILLRHLWKKAGWRPPRT